MDLATAGVGIAGAIGGGGVAALFQWLSARSKAPADLTTAQAAFQTALSQQAEGFIAALQADREGLVKEVNDLRSRVAELENENLQCRGETAQMRQHVESLQEHLRRRGIDIPKGPRPQGLTVLENGKATVITLDAPAAAKKPRRRRTNTNHS